MKKNKNQGFSLVELLIAIAILAIIMVAMASFMNSTTKVYTRTKNDLELQRTGQEVFDLISDKLMQATEVRIGRNGKEYAIYGTNGSNALSSDGNKRLVIKNDTTEIDVDTSGSGYPLYSFSALETSADEIEYICIRYEFKDNASIGRYREVVDCFYFQDNKVYLVRNTASGTRSNAIYNPGSTGTDVAVSGSSNSASMDLDDYINPSAVTEDDLICKNISGIYAYAIPDENAIFLSIDLEKKSMTQVTEGMITIRNSYILQPRGYKADSGTSTTESSEEESSTE